jgi:hypothetical protein
VEPLQNPVLEGLDVDEQPKELVLERSDRRSSTRARAVHARRARCNRSLHIAIVSQALQRFGDKMKTPGHSWLAATGKE